MFFGTTFFDGFTFSFLSHGSPNRQCEIAIRDHTFSTYNGIARKGCGVLSAQHDLPLRVHRKFAHRPGHRTSKAQLARGIKKQQDAIADAAAFAAAPKAGPLVDRQSLTRSRAADGIFNLESDGSASRIGSRRRCSVSNEGDVTGEDDSCAPNELSENESLEVSIAVRSWIAQGRTRRLSDPDRRNRHRARRRAFRGRDRSEQRRTIRCRILSQQKSRRSEDQRSKDQRGKDQRGKDQRASASRRQQLPAISHPWKRMSARRNLGNRGYPSGRV